MINEIIRTHGNNLVIYEGQSPPRWNSPSSGLLRQPTPRDVEARYLTHFFGRDEAVPRIMRLPHRQLTPTGQLYTAQEKKTSPVYNGSRKIRNGLYVRLDGLGESHIVWIIADSTEHGGGWSSTQTGMIERLLPHVRQFARVRGWLMPGRWAVRSGSCWSTAALASFCSTGRARIVAANDLARGHLLQFGGLSDRGGLLNASRVAENTPCSGCCPVRCRRSASRRRPARDDRAP